MPRRERARVQKAADLMRKAMSGGCTEPERRVFYEKALELVQGLLVIPARAVLALESGHRLALNPVSQPGPGSA